MDQVMYFEIQADDPKRAAIFYSDVFGWRFEKDTRLPIDYWRITTGGMLGGLLKRPLSIPTGPAGVNAFVCSIRVDNFDTASKKILQCGGRVALKKFAVVGKCWQGYFWDTEGNTFGIFQVDENAK